MTKKSMDSGSQAAQTSVKERWKGHHQVQDQVTQ